MKVNEIFYSLQGEGRWAGRGAIFIRFSGCNLKCPFCDTDFSKHTDMTPWEIMQEVTKLARDVMVVLTGGEPSLQNEKEMAKLCQLLHIENYYIAIETNGTNLLKQENYDWITISPKDKYLGVTKALPLQNNCNELKVVFDGEAPYPYEYIEADYRYLQPCDTGNKEKNERIIQDCITYIKNNPLWKLSLQTQKILKVR